MPCIPRELEVCSRVYETNFTGKVEKKNKKFTTYQNAATALVASLRERKREREREKERKRIRKFALLSSWTVLEQ